MRSLAARASQRALSWRPRGSPAAASGAGAVEPAVAELGVRSPLAVLRSAFRLRLMGGDEGAVAGVASGGGSAGSDPPHATLLVLPLVALLCGEACHAEAVLRDVDDLARSRARSRAWGPRPLRSGGWSARVSELGPAAVRTRG